MALDSQSQTVDPRPDADARRLAVEAVASLVHIKKTAADQMLRKAGVAEPLILRFLTERDPATGEKRSKRDSIALILEDLAKEGADHAVVRAIVDIAADWTAFHLAQDEYHARAVVQKARELRGILAETDARERSQAEVRRADSAQRHVLEERKILAKESALLLAQFDGASESNSPQERGYLLEDLLNRSFTLHRIPTRRPFRRNAGGEQIDAAFELNGWHYLVECRWRDRLSDIRQLDGLLGQVARSGRQTMGLFLSISGWSEHVVPLLKQNPEKAVFLMEGVDLRAVLDQRIELRQLLKNKIAALNIDANPYLPVARMV